MPQQEVIEVGDARLVYDEQVGQYRDADTGAVTIIEPFLGDAIGAAGDFLGGVAEKAGPWAGALVGGALGGPAGAYGGYQAGGAAGDFVGGLLGDGGQQQPGAGQQQPGGWPEPPGQMPGQGGGQQMPFGPGQAAAGGAMQGGAPMPPQSGGGGAGSSWPAPGPGGQVGAQGGALVPGGRYDLQTAPQGMLQWVMQAAQWLSNTPYGPALVRELARIFGFVRGDHQAPDGQAVHCLAKTLPKDYREALWQFTNGLPGPIGLNKTGRYTFLAMKIAQSGYSPQCCAPGCSDD